MRFSLSNSNGHIVGIPLDDVVRAALDYARSGDKRHLCALMQLLNGGGAAVAHRRLDLVKALLYVVF